MKCCKLLFQSCQFVIIKLKASLFLSFENISSINAVALCQQVRVYIYIYSLHSSLYRVVNGADKKPISKTNIHKCLPILFLYNLRILSKFGFYPTLERLYTRLYQNWCFEIKISMRHYHRPRIIWFFVIIIIYKLNSSYMFFTRFYMNKLKMFLII